MKVSNGKSQQQMDDFGGTFYFCKPHMGKQTIDRIDWSSILVWHPYLSLAHVNAMCEQCLTQTIITTPVSDACQIEYAIHYTSLYRSLFFLL